MIDNPYSTIKTISSFSDDASNVVEKGLEVKDMKVQKDNKDDKELFKKEMDQLTNNQEYTNDERRVFLSKPLLKQVNEKQLIQSVLTR